MTLINPLTPVTQTPFDKVRAGSRVRYVHNHGRELPFEAKVLESKENWGQAAIPAHVFLRDGATEAELLPADGTWRVEVLIDSGIMATAAKSPFALDLIRISTEATAMRFRGGFESGMAVIQFSAGVAATSWHDADAQGLEAIIITTAEGKENLMPGDYLVIENNHADIYTEKRFHETFEIISGEDENAR